MAGTIAGVSEVCELHDDNLADVRRRAGELLADGALVVAPTDTVYGLYANAFMTDATQRVFGVRGATRDAPLTVFIQNPRQLPALAREVTEPAERLMAAYWPGPLTLLLSSGETLSWDLGDGGGTVAVRLPDEEIARELVTEVGPLACTAAALAGQPAPTTIEQAREALGDGVALYVDAGPRMGEPSTIVDVSRGGAEVLRVGAVSADHVFRVAHGVEPWGQQPAADEDAQTP